MTSVMQTQSDWKRDSKYFMMKSRAKGVHSMNSQKMTSGYLEGKIMDKSLMKGSKERSHQPRNVGLEGSAEICRHLVNSRLIIPDADKTTFKNRFGIVEHGSRDDLNSSGATDVRIQSKGMANVQNINIGSNLGSTVVCGNSEFNFDAKPLKTEVKAKQLNDESLKTVPKQPPLDGKPLDDDQLKHGSLNACNRSEFCLEDAKNSESSCKVYTAHHQPTNINDNCGIVLILSIASSMGNQLTKRNINILNNFGTTLVCKNTEILFNVQSSHSVELKQNNEGIIIFDGKQLRGGQSNTKYGLAKSHNRSEFCLGQAVGLSTTEEEVKFEALNATCGDEPIQIDDNSGIVIILVYSGQHHNNASKASDCEESADVENIEVTNNLGNTVVCHDSRVNINLLLKETIKIIDVHDSNIVPLHQEVMLDRKQHEDRLSEIKISSFNRSEFCQS